jgi:hypothetical protein
LFDRVIAKARERELERTGADDDAYSAANRVIIEEAKALAQQALPIAIIVWEAGRAGRPTPLKNSPTSPERRDSR